MSEVYDCLNEPPEEVVALLEHEVEPKSAAYPYLVRARKGWTWSNTPERVDNMTGSSWYSMTWNPKLKLVEWTDAP